MANLVQHLMLCEQCIQLIATLFGFEHLVHFHTTHQHSQFSRAAFGHQAPGHPHARVVLQSQSIARNGHEA